MLQFHVWTKLTTHSDLKSYSSTTLQWTVNVAYPDFPYMLCLVASPNIQSNSVARSPGAKLKISLKMYLRMCCSSMFQAVLGSTSNLNRPRVLPHLPSSVNTPTVNVRFLVCLINWAQCYKDIWGSGAIAPPFLTLTLKEFGGQFHAPLALLPGKESSVPIEEEGGCGPQSWSGHWGVENIFLPLPRTEHRPSRPLARHSTFWRTRLQLINL
jgi:hypothetical protein